MKIVPEQSDAIVHAFEEQQGLVLVRPKEKLAPWQPMHLGFHKQIAASPLGQIAAKIANNK